MSARSRIAGGLLLLAPALLLTDGLYRLFALRFSAGDVYPPCSTLRADPLGARILHDSLAELPGLRVERLLRPLAQAGIEPPATLFLLGADADPFRLGRARNFDELTAFAAAGGRVVVAFAPPALEAYTREQREKERGERAKKEAKDRADKPPAAKEKPAAKKKPSGKPAPSPKKGPADPAPAAGGPRDSTLEALWGVSWRLATNAPTADEAPAAPVPARAEDFDAVSWHSRLYFESTNAAWRTLYACEGRPVLLERAWGKGTLVLAADSYFLSNEAMLKERHPALLAWLAGGAPRLVFDEAHLGVVEEPGVMTLARKYRLQGVLGALLVLALLFLWKNATAFLPPGGAEAEDDEVSAGLETRDGFANLLRRHVPARELPGLCFAEWDRTRPRRPALDARAARMKEALAGEEKDPVELYRELCRILNEGKTL